MAFLPVKRVKRLLIGQFLVIAVTAKYTMRGDRKYIECKPKNQSRHTLTIGINITSTALMRLSIADKFCTSSLLNQDLLALTFDFTLLPEMLALFFR